jgi:hypothetical protein
MGETFEVNDDGALPEVEHRDHLSLSEGYYKNGLKQVREGKILDGLVSLHLSKEHLVGRFAPFELGKRRSLENTLGVIEPAITEAKGLLRQYGPVVRWVPEDSELKTNVSGRD